MLAATGTVNPFTAEKHEPHPTARGLDQHELPLLWGLMRICATMRMKTTLFACSFDSWGSMTLNLQQFRKHGLRPVAVQGPTAVVAAGTRAVSR